MGSAWQGGVTATGNLAGLGANTFTGNQTINGGVTATSFTGDGANLTNLPVDLTQLSATNLTSGTVPDERFPATLPAVSGANLTNLPVDLTQLSATNLTSGTIPDARFPATLPASSGANLTSLPAANLTGTLPNATFPAILPAVDGSALTGIGGGLTGGGNDELFIESDNVMSTDFTTGTNKNYLNLLPLTISATLTVTSGSNISFVSV